MSYMQVDAFQDMYPGRAAAKRKTDILHLDRVGLLSRRGMLHVDFLFPTAALRRQR